ncbi:MAG: putative two component transcriptional regulator, LuxR family [Rhodospirillales bacterium]|nr:putative two component transcriptional regulator, LuxR family [Rhodospirillales bacterium]
MQSGQPPSEYQAGEAMGGISGEETQITVALVGGRRFRQRCLARFLEMSGLHVKIALVENLRESVVGQEGAIDLFVIDTGEHSCSNPEIRRIFTCLGDVLPGVPIVVMSDREDLSAVFDALNLSARAYCPSSLDPDILIEALRIVRKGGTFVPLDMLINAAVHRKRPRGTEAGRTETHCLTRREQRVLELLKEGQPNKVIARELNIEETTVKVHVRRILKKLNAANRTQAAFIAQRMADLVA